MPGDTKHRFCYILGYMVNLICEFKKRKKLKRKLTQLEFFNEGDFYAQTSSQNEYGKKPKAVFDDCSMDTPFEYT